MFHQISGNRYSTMALILLMACGGSKEATTETETTDDNLPPVADAGTDQTVSADAPVVIDGGSSFDPEGESLNFQWALSRVPDGSSLTDSAFTINDSPNPSSSFLPDVAGTFIVSLTVEDASGNMSVSDTALITVEAGELPVANAGQDISSTEGMLITLDGSGSYDVLGRDLSYQWEFAATPQSSSITDLSDPTTSAPSFNPDVAGVYLVSLIVNNGVVNSEPDIASVNVAYANPEAPIADAGDDVIGVEDCSEIALNGSASVDPNGAELTYLWAVQSKPSQSNADASSFQNPTQAVTTFLPDEAGDYLISLSVNDGDMWSTPDIIMVTTIEKSTNVPPTVNAGNPVTVDGGNGECTLNGYTYTCDACEDISVPLGADAVVSDVDGDEIEYEWVVTSGNAVIDDPYSLTTSITLEDAEPLEPTLCEPTEYELQLQATDCPGDESFDSVIYTVSCCGLAVSQ